MRLTRWLYVTALLVPLTARRQTDQNGPVIATPRFRPYFWGQWDVATHNQVQADFDTITNSPAFYNRLLEYGIGQGSSGPPPDIPVSNTYGNLLAGPQWANCYPGGGSLDGNIAAWLDIYIDPSDVTSNDIFVVFLPSTVIDLSDCTSLTECAQPSQPPPIGPYGGYHSETDLGYVYAVVEGSYPPERIETLTHEMTEAMTNPHPCHNPAWRDNITSTSSKEVCDLCAKNPLMANGNPIAHEIQGLPVWQVWSNAACRCVTKRDVTLGDGFCCLSSFRTDVVYFA
ncbi:MAG: hypothetical protein ABTD50_09555 [Polyangiaceae bacterium]|jgi:hypothetical protein